MHIIMPSSEAVFRLLGAGKRDSFVLTFQPKNESLLRGQNAISIKTEASTYI